MKLPVDDEVRVLDELTEEQKAAIAKHKAQALNRIRARAEKG